MIVRPYFHYTHMGPKKKFCSTKMSKDSVLAKLFDLLIKMTFSSLSVSKRKSKTTSEYKHTPNQWEILPQKTLLITGKSFSQDKRKNKYRDRDIQSKLVIVVQLAIPYK